MASWDQAPVAKGGNWDSAPVAASKVRAATDAKKRSASTPGFVRSLSQGFTFGFGDELDAKTAGIETAIGNVGRRITGREIPYTAREAEEAVLQEERARQRRFAKEQPVADFAGQVIGGAALPSAGILKGATGVTSAVRRGAAVGAAAGYGYGLGNAEGGFLERQPSALGGAALGGLVGGAAGRLTAGSPSKSVARPGASQVATSAAQRLASEGVSLTPGQRMGGLAKTFEDRAMGTVPILGDAIRGARRRGENSLQRAATNRALRPIGGELPSDVDIGIDSTRYAREQLSQAYDDALSQVEVAQVDEPLIQGLAAVNDGLVDLGDDLQAQFRRIIDNRVTSRFRNGIADGETLKDIQSQLGTLADDYQASTDPAQRNMGRLFEAVSDEILGLAARNSPDGGEAIRNANAGWANFARVRNAGSKLGAESGQFTPAQLRNAVRAEDTSVGKGRFATGESLMYDLADDAASVMSSKIPDSGTAGRLGLGALGATALTNPSVGIPTIAGLAVAAAPYFAMGRTTPEALQRVLTLAQRSAAIGRPAPAQVREYVSQAKGALGASHPFVQQLEAFIASPNALADEEDPNAPAVTVETVGDMSVADWLRAQEQPR